MRRRGILYFKTFHSVVGKFNHKTIGITTVKGLFIPVNALLWIEPAWVNLAKSTAVRKSVDVICQLLQEAPPELTRCVELIPGYPEYMALIDASGEG